MKKYYTHNGTEQQGAFSFEELKNQKLTLDTMIWYEGMETWSKAGDIAELKELFIVSPPAFVKQPPVITKVEQKPIVSYSVIDKAKTKEIHNPSTGKAKTKQNMVFVYAIVGLVAIIGIISGVIIYNKSQQEETIYYVPPVTNENSSNPTPSNNSDNQSQPKPENNNSYTPPTEYTPPTPSETPKTKDELMMELRKAEMNDPKGYLYLTYTTKVNLASNTITEGDIENRAAWAGFKNVHIHLDFLSKTDVVVGSEDFVVMEYISSSSKVHFRYKIKGYWSKASAVRATITSAEGY